MLLAAVCVLSGGCRNEHADRPRVLISTDIGGTDPDDNQSMVHLLMYSDRFDIEGLVSSPSFGEGSKEEILRMIDLYAQDYPSLKPHYPDLSSPEDLRAVCRQGRRGLASACGYGEPTEGSEWIVRCARRADDRPLWVLVWGTLEDLAQALHDAPDIASRIRVYWIGGPNKKWGVNSYAYIAEHFPDLWMIENNASYRGFISAEKGDDRFRFYNESLRAAGAMGADFIRYYDGVIKMGDSPSLFYLMHGDPDDPTAESWGGSFVPVRHSSRRRIAVSHGAVDTVHVYSVVEMIVEVKSSEGADTVAVAEAVADAGSSTDTDAGVRLLIDRQEWPGTPLGDGRYMIRYSPKQPAVLPYVISASLPGFRPVEGQLVVDDLWPGLPCDSDYPLGPTWYTDRPDRDLYDGKWQGYKTVSRWRDSVLADWHSRLVRLHPEK